MVVLNVIRRGDQTTVIAGMVMPPPNGWLCLWNVTQLLTGIA
jgi:hypothetical protein